MSRGQVPCTHSTKLQSSRHSITCTVVSSSTLLNTRLKGKVGGGGGCVLEFILISVDCHEYFWNETAAETCHCRCWELQVFFIGFSPVWCCQKRYTTLSPGHVDFPNLQRRLFRADFICGDLIRCGGRKLLRTAFALRDNLSQWGGFFLGDAFSTFPAHAGSPSCTCWFNKRDETWQGLHRKVYHQTHTQTLWRHKANTSPNTYINKVWIDTVSCRWSTSRMSLRTISDAARMTTTDVEFLSGTTAAIAPTTTSWMMRRSIQLGSILGNTNLRLIMLRCVSARKLHAVSHITGFVFWIHVFGSWPLPMQHWCSEYVDAWHATAALWIWACHLSKYVSHNG